MDVETVRLHARLTSFRRREETARQMVADHLAAAPRSYVSWSGGKDSTVVAHLTAESDPSVLIMRCSHGVDYPENIAYCEQIAARHGWNYQVSETETAEQYAARIGAFDEPSNTSYVAEAAALLGHEPDGWLYGLRADESTARRWRLAPRAGTWTAASGHRVSAPIWDWSLLDVHAYHWTRDVPLNPIYARLTQLGCPDRAQRVGFMIGGRGAEWGRYSWLRAGWPDEWRQLLCIAPWLRDVS